MRRFNMSVAKVKNAKGEYESIPALRDRSGYESAKANGYTGTEEEWLNDIYSDGWITAIQELDGKKADKTELEEAIDTILTTIVPPWNLNENIGDICNGTTVSVGTSSNALTLTKNGYAIPMINSGTIRIKGNTLIKWINSKSADYNYLNTFAKIYVNETLVYEMYAPDTVPTSTNVLVSEDFTQDVEVKKGDVLSFIVSAESMHDGSIKLESAISNIKLYANIETPFTYRDLMETLENPSTTEILNTLLA